MPLSVPEPADFLQYAQWAGILTLVCGTIAILGFIFKWGIRFRFVGVTGFMLVLTVGLLSLGFVPLTRTVIPGAVRYATVYDSGATQVVITVPATISASELRATLAQAASDLFSPGRLGRSGEPLVIRARAVLHPTAGVTQPLYLGQVERSLQVRNDDNMTITLFDENLAQLPPAPPTATATSS